jgi:hypothetical protein
MQQFRWFKPMSREKTRPEKLPKQESSEARRGSLSLLEVHNISEHKSIILFIFTNPTFTCPSNLSRCSTKSVQDSNKCGEAATKANKVSLEGGAERTPRVQLI